MDMGTTGEVTLIPTMTTTTVMMIMTMATVAVMVIVLVGADVADHPHL